jgi:hypothetical protein
MSIGFNRLKAENAKLRSEIRRLKYSLRGYSGDTSYKSSSSILKESNRSHSNYRPRSSPKLLDLKYESRKRGRSPLSTLQPKSREDIIPTPSISTFDTHNSIYSTKRNMSSQSKVESVSKDILPKKEDLSPFRTLKDSFDSYYDSEEENLDRIGKCELSFMEYQQVPKGERRKERSLSKWVEELKQENEELKQKLENRKVPKLKISKRKKSSRRSTSRGSLPTTPNSRSSRRSKRSMHLLFNKSPSNRHIHCKICTQLLAKGYSTWFCSKHGKK